MTLQLPRKATKAKLEEFAADLQDISRKVGFKLSSRGWCYQLETEGAIDKSEFGKVERLINQCRKRGILPIDFTAEEQGRQFEGVEVPDRDSPIQDLRLWIESALNSECKYTPDWWDGEAYYVQMIVEKIDLVTLFSPVCWKYKIPIATSKGWSSMLQRAVYAQRFQEAEEKGLKPLLLYCGDHDPDGLRISDFLRKNLADLKAIQWVNGEVGYNPQNLEIVRFGLNYAFIQRYNLSWIDNLITGSGKNLASRSHKNHEMDYVQEYIKEFGVRKCEANALVVIPQIAREFVDQTIKGYLGEDAEKRFRDKRQAVIDEVKNFRERTGLDDHLEKALEIIDEAERGEP